MILAAGLADANAAADQRTAKPLLMLGGRALLDHALDNLVAEGVTTVVVNAFWQADKIVAHLARRPPPPDRSPFVKIRLLDTGGGVRDARARLGSQPFFVINGDAFWLNGPATALGRLAAAFDDDVDVVLLVHRTFQVARGNRPGDFAVDQLGRPTTAAGAGVGAIYIRRRVADATGTA